MDPPQYKIVKLGIKLGTSSDQDWEIGKKTGLRLGIGYPSGPFILPYSLSLDTPARAGDALGVDSSVTHCGMSFAFEETQVLSYPMY